MDFKKLYCLGLLAFSVYLSGNEPLLNDYSIMDHESFISNYEEFLKDKKLDVIIFAPDQNSLIRKAIHNLTDKEAVLIYKDYQKYNRLMNEHEFLLDESLENFKKKFFGAGTLGLFLTAVSVDIARSLYKNLVNTEPVSLSNIANIVGNCLFIRFYEGTMKIIVAELVLQCDNYMENTKLKRVLPQYINHISMLLAERVSRINAEDLIELVSYSPKISAMKPNT